MGTFNIPLFPLNTVLFPGMPISLHIFEERYKRMISECIQTRQPFGVVLIQDGQEALGPLARPYMVGCTAQIIQIEQLTDGRMNIVAVGLERFQIRSLSYDQPYLMGQVEVFPLASFDQQRIAQAGRQLRPWVERYLSVLAQVSEQIDFDPHRLPSDPLALGYLAAALVQIPADQKQTLLSAGQASEMLTDVETIYRREVALLDVMMDHDDSGQGFSVFSFN